MLGKPTNKYCFLIGQTLVMSLLYETHIGDVITLCFLVLKCFHQFSCSSHQKQGSPSTITGGCFTPKQPGHFKGIKRPWVHLFVKQPGHFTPSPEKVRPFYGKTDFLRHNFCTHPNIMLCFAKIFSAKDQWYEIKPFCSSHFWGRSFMREHLTTTYFIELHYTMLITPD